MPKSSSWRSQKTTALPWLRGLCVLSAVACSMVFIRTDVDSVIAQSVPTEFLRTNGNIMSTGVPPIPISLVRQVEPYMGMYGLLLAGWDKSNREILLKGMSSVAWISGVKSLEASPKTAIYIRASDVYDLYPQPQGKYLAYTVDVNGNESFQLYLFNIGTETSTLLSDNKSRNTEPVWSKDGRWIVYSSSPNGADGVNLRLIDPSNKSSDRLLVESSGGYLKAFDWSPDGKEVVFCDFSANSASTLWVLDIATGTKKLLSPKSSGRDFYDAAQFSRDGNGVFVITDHNSDFRRLAYIDLKSLKLHFISPPGKSDVDEFQMSPNGERVAYITNDQGTSKLWVLATKSGKVHFYQKVPAAVISDLKWNSESTELAFNLKSTSTPNDIYSVSVETGAIERWSQGVTNEISSTRFAKPELIHWRSFDKQIISGFMYRPPSTFKGKRPVIIDLHGGPEEQFKPAFNYTDNFFINELGIAKIYPNVRGSTGYGKGFLNSDNDAQREDAVKDIGALLDWIKTQPDLDGDRVLVEGASYGGYLALSVACTYGARIRGTISDSGISNLASFVAHTEGWRRGLQRAEFGDERDPRIRAFLERIAPVNNAKKISKPLLIIQGQNDPRVPIGEAEQIVKATKGRVPVWYIVGKNEGHGFSQLENRNYQLYATILFVKQFLLN